MQAQAAREGRAGAGVARDITIVKLGGSFAYEAGLRDWLDAIAALRGRCVVTPGGGPFADAVRAAQPAMGFDEAAAHEMALLAMAQYGRALCALHPAFTLAASKRAIHAALARGEAPVWEPRAMAMAAKLPECWALTSDSLAAWLAGALGARRLVLVKHGSFGPRVEAEALAAAGVVDAMFPAFARAAGARAFIAPQDAADCLARGLRDDAFPEILLS